MEEGRELLMGMTRPSTHFFNDRKVVSSIKTSQCLKTVKIRFQVEFLEVILSLKATNVSGLEGKHTAPIHFSDSLVCFSL